MRISVQREACRKMPQHARYGLDVHSVLQCQRCEGVSEVVKSDVRQSGVFQDFLVQIYDGVWVVHLAGCRRGEHVGILRMLAMLCYAYADTYADIAKRVGISEKNVSVRLTLIRQKMKQYLIEREVFV